MNENPTNANEQFELGKKYEEGDGVPKDLEKAKYWYTKAAEQGHVGAKGMVLIKELEEGEKEIYKIGCSGNAAADELVRKGMWIMRGDEEDKYKKAEPLFLEAAEQGHMGAQHVLGEIYDDGGEGVGRDQEKAVYWYTKAAEQGHAIAQSNLGTLYYNGYYKGYDEIKNHRKAKYWHTKAAKQGNEVAQRNLSNLEYGCYVATCVYGSYDCPEVWTLRRYRDGKLSKTWFGRLFIRAYYAVSPKIVSLFGNRSWFNGLCKPVLDKIVRSLRNSGIDSGPYLDM
jgi:hypothetical protein